MERPAAPASRLREFAVMTASDGGKWGRDTPGRTGRQTGSRFSLWVVPALVGLLVYGGAFWWTRPSPRRVMSVPREWQSRSRYLSLVGIVRSRRSPGGLAVVVSQVDEAGRVGLLDLDTGEFSGWRAAGGSWDWRFMTERGDRRLVMPDRLEGGNIDSGRSFSWVRPIGVEESEPQGFLSAERLESESPSITDQIRSSIARLSGAPVSESMSRRHLTFRWSWYDRKSRIETSIRSYSGSAESAILTRDELILLVPTVSNARLEFWDLPVRPAPWWIPPAAGVTVTLLAAATLRWRRARGKWPGTGVSTASQDSPNVVIAPEDGHPSGSPCPPNEPIAG